MSANYLVLLRCTLANFLPDKTSLSYVLRSKRLILLEIVLLKLLYFWNLVCLGFSFPLNAVSLGELKTTKENKQDLWFVALTVWSGRQVSKAIIPRAMNPFYAGAWKSNET